MSAPLTLAEAALRMNVHVKTLQRWDRSGKLVAKRTAFNRRYYLQEQVDAYLRASSATSEDGQAP